MTSTLKYCLIWNRQKYNTAVNTSTDIYFTSGSRDQCVLWMWWVQRTRSNRVIAGDEHVDLDIHLAWRRTSLNISSKKSEFIFGTLLMFLLIIYKNLSNYDKDNFWNFKTNLFISHWKRKTARSFFRKETFWNETDNFYYEL